MVRVGSILHVGCGNQPLPNWISGKETRVDIDPSSNCDIVADMCDLGEIGKFDAVFSSHSLEHLYVHDIQKALKGFHRVLNNGGILIAIVPDIEGISPSDDVLYESPSGPVTGMDIIYGAQWLLKDMPYMAHHYGFTKEIMERHLRDAGFKGVSVIRAGDYNLVSMAVK